MRVLSLAFVACITVSAFPDSPLLAAPGWKAGFSKSVITPQKPMWMAGYGSRTSPAEGAEHDLYLRVLALEDADGRRGVVVATDTLGIPRAMYDDVATRLRIEFGLDRSQFLLHASHTHCGPVLRGALYDAYPLDQHQLKFIEEYSDWLTNEIVTGIGRALQDLSPAELSRGVGMSDFAVNRRTNREADVPALREQNQLFGPVDHTVPVLAIKDGEGKLRGVVFAYACHNTTLSYQKWCGDYAGFAQLDLETLHPGAVALFCMGCGADQNPLPRRSVELAKSYGKKLADSVQAVLGASMASVRPDLQMTHHFTSLTLPDLPSREELQVMADGPVDYRQRWAARMLEMDPKTRPSVYRYPVTAWRLGNEQLWITLGGEVVVDFSLRLKAELGEETWITAYSNDVMAYIPSRRVLLEGGYEGQSSMLIYGLPALRWADDVEEQVVKAVRTCVQRITTP